MTRQTINRPFPVLMLAAIALSGSCTGPSTASHIERSLAAAVEFDASRSEIREFSQAYSTEMGMPADRLVWQTLGRSNLSAFLLTVDATSELKLYDLSFHISGERHPREVLQSGNRSFAERISLSFNGLKTRRASGASGSRCRGLSPASASSACHAPATVRESLISGLLRRTRTTSGKRYEFSATDNEAAQKREGTTRPVVRTPQGRRRTPARSAHERRGSELSTTNAPRQKEIQRICKTS